MSKNTNIHPVGRVRKRVREILFLAKGYYLSEASIVSFTNELLEPDAPLNEVRSAVEWNVAEGFLDSKMNEETEEREWIITKAGIAKENIS